MNAFLVMTTCTSFEIVATTYHTPPYGANVPFPVNNVAYIYIAPYHNHNLMLVYDQNLINVD